MEESAGSFSNDWKNWGFFFQRLEEFRGGFSEHWKKRGAGRPEGCKQAGRGVRAGSERSSRLVVGRGTIPRPPQPPTLPAIRPVPGATLCEPRAVRGDWQPRRLGGQNGCSATRSAAGGASPPKMPPLWCPLSFPPFGGDHCWRGLGRGGVQRGGREGGNKVAEEAFCMTTRRGRAGSRGGWAAAGASQGVKRGENASKRACRGVQRL